jgi:hypothetical protein
MSHAAARMSSPVPPMMDSVTRVKGKVLRKTTADSYRTHPVSRSVHLA